MYLSSARFLLACTVIFLAHSPARADEPLPTGRLSTRLACPAVMAARDSVVLLRDADEFLGTGFLFADAETVATAAHVPASIAVDRRGRVYALRRIAADHPRDIALYRVDRPIAGATPLVAGTPEPGVSVFSIGHPNGDDATEARLPGIYRWSVIHGMVSGVSDDWVLTNFVPAGGASGSPLLTCDGSLIGVLHGYDRPAIYARFANARGLTHLYMTQRSIASPTPPNHFVAEFAIDVDQLTDQLGLNIGIAWVGDAVWGARVATSLSTNTFSGDLGRDGRINLLRLSMDLLAQLGDVFTTPDRIELATGAGWKRRWSTPIVAEDPTAIDDHLVPRIAVRYYIGRTSPDFFIALQAEAEVGDGIEPSLWFQLGYRLGRL